jgi:uncharacterized protein
MSLNRRDFLIFMGAAIAARSVQGCTPTGTPNGTMVKAPSVGFRPLQGPTPLATSGIPIAEQITQLATYEIKDDLVLPEGYEYQVLATWGDKIGTDRFGFNNDYLALVETGSNEGVLSINFEYISTVPWLQSYEKVMGTALPIASIEAKLKQSKEGVDAFSLPDTDPLKQKIKTVCKAALADQGLGFIAVKRNAKGQWERTHSTTLDRRISGIAGLENGKYLKCTGPGRSVFLKTAGQGYIDKLGDRIIGTFANCAGGITPWGTVLSGEENIQSQVPEAVYADGTSFSPKERAVSIGSEEVSGQGNVLGLAGNKYGWVVEVDPTNPKDPGTKHTWLGRYRHEAVGVRVEVDKPIAFYSGCDRRGGHLYKFVSRDKVKTKTDKANSKLMNDGMLYAAKFNADGTGKWIALEAKTAINPDRPSDHVGGMINLPNRPEGGFKKFDKDEDIEAYKQKYKTLGDLYQGNPQEKQGAILIDAHFAASAIGATCTARPEDTEIAPDGSLYIAFTSGAESKSDGSPDKRIFKGPKGETPYEYGFVTHLTEDKNEPGSLTFTWKMFALGGDITAGGSGFSNPDNLMIDSKSNIWTVCDTPSDRLNQSIASRMGSSDLRGLFGNNAMWCIPSQGPDAGRAHLFAIGPMESELTGPFLSQDERSLFLAVQHPGEINGTREKMNAETRPFQLLNDQGQQFPQKRSVPIGSNFPDLKPDSPAKSSIVVITRKDGKPIYG